MVRAEACGKEVRYYLCPISDCNERFRDFIESHLLDFAKSNPGVVVYVKPRRHRTAVMVGEYCKSLILWFSIIRLMFLFGGFH